MHALDSGLAVLSPSDVDGEWKASKKRNAQFLSTMILRSPGSKYFLCRFCPANQIPSIYSRNPTLVSKHFNDAHLRRTPDQRTPFSIGSLPRSMDALEN